MRKLNCHSATVSAIQEVLGPDTEPSREFKVGQANGLLKCADVILKCKVPHLYDYFEKRQQKLPLLETAYTMALSGWHDTARMLLHLRYDQILKQEQVSQKPLSKGPALCDSAILQQVIGSASGIRYYASLAVIADVLCATNQGGLALQLLLQFESRQEIEQWCQKLMRQFRVKEKIKKPVHVEAGLAARWFYEQRGEKILALSKVKKQGPPHFLDLLLEESKSDKQGVLFEACVGLIISSTPGFEVRYAFSEPDEQVDLLVNHKSESSGILYLPDGYGLVECRSTKDPVGAPELRDFGAKCFMHGASYGILAARSGITGGENKYRAAQLTRRKFLHQGIILLAVNQDKLGEARFQRRGLVNALRNDYEVLAFGVPPQKAF